MLSRGSVMTTLVSRISGPPLINFWKFCGPPLINFLASAEGAGKKLALFRYKNWILLTKMDFWVKFSKKFRLRRNAILFCIYTFILIGEYFCVPNKKVPLINFREIFPTPPRLLILGWDENFNNFDFFIYSYYEQAVLSGSIYQIVMILANFVIKNAS